MQLQRIKRQLLDDYLKHCIPLKSAFDALVDAELSTDNFSFYTSLASVYSSKIEGEEIELDSYVKHKRWGEAFQPDYTRKIDDLYSAYDFAQAHALTPENIASAHALLARNLVAENQLGRLRSGNMYVTTPDGKIEYVAATPQELPIEMATFYADLEMLLHQQLTMEEAFYYASYLHLVFVKIHPWTDGNGRTARLLEKWFLAHHLGEKAWFIQSERYYYEHHAQYYTNLRALGLEYETLDYDKALPFLEMLGRSLRNGW